MAAGGRGKSPGGRLRDTFLALLLAVSAASLGLPAAAGPAIGQFELKDLEAGAGYMEFQSQNAWSFGQPGRKMATAPSGETLYDDNTVLKQRHALEIEMGFSTYLKMRLGIEFEKERIDDPTSRLEANAFDDLTLSELGGEVIAILVPREGDGAGLGLVVEVERPLESEEQTGLVFGPILELASGPWSASLIPMLVYSFGGEVEPGEQRDNKLDFAYAAQATYTFSETWALAIEAYGTVERVLGAGHPSEEVRLFGDHTQHRLGPVLYYSYDIEDDGPTVSIGTGFLAGLTPDTPDGTLKLSVEVEF